MNGNTPSSGSGLWTTTSTAIITASSSPTSTVTGLTTAGTYSFIWTITNGACVSRDTVVITVNASVISNAGSDQQLCSTTTSTALAGNTATPGTGTWTTTSAATITTPSSPTSTVTGLIAGTFDFVWTIVNGTCTSSDTMTIDVDSISTPADAGVDQITCVNNGASLSGNTPTTGIGTWTTTSGATIADTLSPLTTVSNLSAGDNLFVWTITNGTCVSSDTMIIHANANPVADAGVDLFVSSGVTTLIGGAPTASGGTSPYIYTWSPLTFLDDSTLANPSSTPLTTIIYTLNVSDSLGCAATDTITVFVNTAPVATDDTLTIYEDSTTVIIALANDSDYESNINIGTVQIINGPYNGSAIVDPLTGVITYTPSLNYFGVDSMMYAVCDSGMPVYCDTAWIYLTILPVNDAPVANDDFASTPEDTCITINVLSNDTDIENNINPSSLAIVVYPQHGTATLDTIAGQIIYCPDNSFNGVDTIMYAICDSGMPVLCDTAYIIITVTPINNAPTALNDSITLCSSDSIIISILNNDFEIDGDSITATILTMPQHGNAAIDSVYQMVYDATYGYEGIDSIAYSLCDNATPSLCDTGYVIITVHANPLVSTITNHIKCFGDSIGAIDLTATGNSPFTYLWNTSATTEDIDSLPSGIYQVNISDSNNCSTVFIDTITQPAAPLSVASVLQSVKCFGDSSGTIQLIASGGTAPYQFNWNTGDSTSTINLLPQGIYAVTITDTNGCVVNLIDTLTEPASALTATSVIINVNCFGDATGSIQLNVSGGTTPYNFIWSNGDTTILNDSLGAGIYMAMIVDTNGCGMILSDTIIELSTAITSNFITQAPQCLSATGGTIFVTVTGGTTPYQYTWSTGDTLDVADSLFAGNYSVVITDQLGCNDTAVASLADSSIFSVQAIGDTIFCEGDSVMLLATYYANSIYQWYADTIAINSADSSNYNSVANGNYYVTLTNGCGVFTSATIQTIKNPLPILVVTDDFTTVCDSALNLSASGALNYQWLPTTALDDAINSNPIATLQSSKLFPAAPGKV